MPYSNHARDYADVEAAFLHARANPDGARIDFPTPQLAARWVARARNYRKNVALDHVRGTQWPWITLRYLDAPGHEVPMGQRISAAVLVKDENQWANLKITPMNGIHLAQKSDDELAWEIDAHQYQAECAAGLRELFSGKATPAGVKKGLQDRQLPKKPGATFTFDAAWLEEAGLAPQPATGAPKPEPAGYQGEPELDAKGLFG